MKKLLTPTIIFLTTLALTYGLVTTFKTPQQAVGIALPQAVAVFETSLQTGITSTATSMTLTANAIRGGGALSGFNCFTVDEGNTNAETICGTVTTTAVASLSRGVSQSDGLTEVTTLKFSHRRGANVKITDFPIIQRLKAQNNGEATFINQLSYETALTPTDDADIISKKYADDLAIAGAPDASLTVKGLLEVASQIGMASTSVAGTGDTTAPLALTAAYSTSTPTVRGLYIPVAQNDGYLSQLWTRLSDAYTWTGAHIFSSTVNVAGNFTATATSTMATTTLSKLTVTENVTATGGTSAFGTVTSTTLTNSGTASTTDMIISGTCTGCVDIFSGTDSTPSDTTTDTNTQAVGFQPTKIEFWLDAQDSSAGNDRGRAWGIWEGGTFNSMIIDDLGAGWTVELGTAMFVDNFTDSNLSITINNVTSTGFDIVYTKGGANNTTANVRYTATK